MLLWRSKLRILAICGLGVLQVSKHGDRHTHGPEEQRGEYEPDSARVRPESPHTPPDNCVSNSELVRGKEDLSSQA